MALVTIITVVYNGKKTLEDTIKSVVSLGKKDVQYIVVDGGSKDGTVEIITTYSSAIDIWVSEPDRGIYDAMNKGWKLANVNSYVLFLGAGDKILSLPNNLADDYSKVYYGDVQIGTKVFRSSYDFRLCLGNTIHHQALLIPKSLNKEAPFDTSYKIYADFDFNQKLLKAKVPFEYSSKLKGYALPGGVSGNRADAEMLSIVKKNFGITVKLIAIIYYKLQKLKSFFN